MDVDTIPVVRPQSLCQDEAVAATTARTPRTSASGFPWMKPRQPFSPPTMGHALPYLDVFTVQSKRLLPVSRGELLLGKRPQPQKPSRDNDQVAPLPGDPSATDTSRATINDGDGMTGAVACGGREEADDHIERLDVATDEYRSSSAYPSKEMLQGVRLLVEPVAIPDLTHTGVSWQFAESGRATGGTNSQAFCVSVPNHTFEETQVKLFYPTGAKNSNIREYIRDTIQTHMSGLIPQASSTNDVMHPSHSAPHLTTAFESIATGDAGTPSKHVKAKKKKQHSNSPTKMSPQKTNGISSGARLSGSVSTSGLLNPELSRQAKDILAQLRSNTNKINDLIGS